MRALNIRLLAGIGAFACAASLAHADTQAIAIDTVGTYPPLTNHGFNYYQPPGNYTFDWTFTVNSAIDVMQLGYYNSALAGTPEPNGFGSHLITLTDLSTESPPLAQARVTGTSPASGVFNYAPIAPVTLNINDVYSISGTTSDQFYLVGYNQSATPTAPQINYQFTTPNIFGAPGPAGTYSDFGPNFQFASTATCTENVPGRNVIALLGDQCTASGAYHPTTSNVSLPVPYTGFGLYAHGGAISSTSPVAIVTSGPSASHGAWAAGPGSQITFGGATTITTGGANSYAAYASGGGLIIATGAFGANTSGSGATGVYASGSGSSIAIDGGVAALASISTTGAAAHGVLADAGALVNLRGGAATTAGDQAYGLFANGAASRITADGVAVATSGAQSIGVFAYAGGAVALGSDFPGHASSVSTTGLSADAVVAGGGGAFTMDGGRVSTTGAGSSGLVIVDASSTLTASNLTVTTTGGVDTQTQFYANGIYNGPSPTGTSGGTALVSNVAVSTSGTNIADVSTGAGGHTTFLGGSATASGGGAIGFYTFNGGSSVVGLNANNLGAAVSTTGAYAPGVLTTSGGMTSITGGSVTTSGGGAAGLYATSANSVIGATNVAVSTAGGLYAHAALAEAGGTVNVKGGSLVTSGQSAYAAGVTSGGSMRLDGVAVTATGMGSGGLFVNGATGSLTGANLTISVRGGYDAASGFTAAGVVNQSYQNYIGGGSLSLTNSSITVGALGGAGVYAADAGVTTITGGQVGTVGVQSDAINASSRATVTLSGVRLTTTGDASKGLNVQGTGTILTGSNLTISTSGTIDPATGFHSQGVFNGTGSRAGARNTGGGSVTLTDTSVTTSGVKSIGVETANNGVTRFTGGAIATSGDASSGVVSASGAATTIGLDALGVATTISTSGLSTGGGVAVSGASLALIGAAVSTTGDGSTGLVVRDLGSSLTATNVTVGTTGGIDAATGIHADAIYNGPNSTSLSGGALALINVTASAAGFESSGLSTGKGGISTVSGGAFSTTGESAPAVLVVNAGQLQISAATLSTNGPGSPGLVLKGTGGVVVADSLNITTSGQVSTATGSHADGIYNGSFGGFIGGGAMSVTDTTIRTSGFQAHGVSVGQGGATTFLGGAVTTQGQGAHAAFASNGGSLTIGLDKAGNSATLMTGSGAYVVSAVAGGSIVVTGASIRSTGDGSGGLSVNGAGSQIDATHVDIAIAGGLDPVTGLPAYGAANSPYGSFSTGGVLNLSGSSVETFGQNTFGVYTGAQSTTAITGGVITTYGAGAHAIYATDVGASVTVGGTNVSTFGAGAYGAYVAAGASLSLTDGVHLRAFGDAGGGVQVTGAGSLATLEGTIGISSQVGGAALWAGAGGAISAKGLLGLLAQGTAIRIDSASVAAPGALFIEAKSQKDAAIRLSGDNASFSGTGGGTILAAGPVVAFLNGANQSATFSGYTILNTSGDLVFADPSSSTLNFNNTTVNAGAGNLVNATNFSAVTLNASHSSLTGAVATDATSTTDFNLNKASALTLTGNSTITNLTLNNSALGFTAPTGGAFQTLTVTNFNGTGGALTLNALLSGAAPGADQLVVNGGRATGTTLLTIAPIGNFAGSLASPGVPLIVATNGGSIAPGAFALASPLVVNGYLYTLQETGGGDFLVSNSTQTTAQGQSSLASLSQSRQTQTITSKLLGSILTGATEQMNCSSCSSGFASFGSFALGAHGRWTLSPSLALLAGGSYNSFSGRGVTVNNSLQVALALRYDMVALGKNRPFAEAGLSVQPWASVTYRRAYASALGGGVGTGTALSRSVAAYGRLGYIWRLTPTDEAAVYTDLTHAWDTTSGYTESATPGNPNGATVAGTLDTINIWRVGAQYTHLFGKHIEGNLSGGYARAFGAAYGTSAALGGLGVTTGAAATGFDWWEIGGRVSYRFSKMLTGDLFAIGALGAQPVGNQIHGGAALRMAF